MERVKKVLKKFGKTGVICIFLVCAFAAGNTTGHAPSVQVLSATTHKTPTPTQTPVPTHPASSGSPVTVINNIIIPTSVPILVTQIVTPTPVSNAASATPIPTQIPLQPTESPTLTPVVPTPSVLPTATPTPVAQTVEVDIEYAGQHAESTYTTSLTNGETAWQAVQDAVGLSNLHYTDYGGSLGIFITGFNGVDALSNQYYDFQVNGASSNTGVSSYAVADHDVLKFVLTGF